MNQTPEQLAQTLAAHPDYRVLRRLNFDLPSGPNDSRFPIKTLVLDCEATGLDTQNDKVFDVGMVLVSHDAAGNVGPIIATYSGLQDPCEPLKPEIVELTGYTDDDLRGHQFDLSRIQQLFLEADMVVAHHAAYDRKMFERLAPAAAQADWVCSFLDIPWKSLGLGSAKLDYLIYQLGYFFDGHTALADTQALVKVIAESPTGDPTLASLFGQLYRANANPPVRIAALGSPFHTKDALKAKSYRWNDGANGFPKAWWKDFSPDQVQAELAWLTRDIYGADANRLARVEVLSPKDRYSTRIL